MRRWTWLPAIAVSLLLGCGGQASAPTPTENLDPVPPAASKPADPTPVLPIPDDAPGTDPEAASQVPIKPIPE
jgi:hypothetical protein